MLRYALLAVLIGLACSGTASAQQAVIVVRHAEKAETPVDDPPLTPAGETRAARLAAMLRDSGVKAIYATGFERTRRTAQPSATAFKLPISDMPDSLDAWVATLRSEHAEDVVLVVGHSNTIPEILQKLGYDQPITIPETEYDNFFVVIPRPRGGARNVLRLRY